MPWILPLEAAHSVHSEARAGALLEIADMDARPPRHRFGGGKARAERRHVLGAFLQRIPGGDQPPNLVQAKRTHRLMADVPVPAVGRIERAAEKADARHALPLA